MIYTGIFNKKCNSLKADVSKSKAKRLQIVKAKDKNHGRHRGEQAVKYPERAALTGHC